MKLLGQILLFPIKFVLAVLLLILIGAIFLCKIALSLTVIFLPIVGFIMMFVPGMFWVGAIMFLVGICLWT